MPVFREAEVIHASTIEAFNIVLDVESYPKFLPWCHDVKIVDKYDNVIVADLVIRFNLIKVSYRSRIDFVSPKSTKNSGYITTHAVKGLFEHLHNKWEFHPYDADQCLVKFYLDFKIKSPALRLLLQPIYKTAQRKIINAFAKMLIKDMGKL